MRVTIEKQGLNPPLVEEGKVHEIDPVGFLVNVKVNTPAKHLAVYSDISVEEEDQKSAVLKLTCVEPDPELSIGTTSSETTIRLIAENDYEAEQVWGLHSFLSTEGRILLLISEQNLDCRTKPFGVEP